MNIYVRHAEFTGVLTTSVANSCQRSFTEAGRLFAVWHDWQK